MKFYLGSPPVSDEVVFHSEGEGWHQLRIDPSPGWLILLALPASFFLFVAGIFFYLLLSRQDSFLLSFHWIDFLLLPVLIVVHELIHALTMPDYRKVLIGVWPSRAMFYAYYDGVMSRNRFLWVGVMPYLLLGLFPLFLAALFPLPSFVEERFVNFGLVGSLAASGDLIVFLAILLQVPSSAEVHNQGWKTYWRITTQ